MGWDAYAKPVDNDWKKDGRIVNRRQRRVFKEASKEVYEKAGTVDWLLDKGGLDVSTCGEMLAQATGQSVYDENGWNKKRVKELSRTADWSFIDHPVDIEDLWAYWSAKKFLEACAKLGLGIRFSY